MGNCPKRSQKKKNDVYRKCLEYLADQVVTGLYLASDWLREFSEYPTDQSQGVVKQEQCKPGFLLTVTFGFVAASLSDQALEIWQLARELYILSYIEV